MANEQRQQDETPAHQGALRPGLVDAVVGSQFGAVDGASSRQVSRLFTRRGDADDVPEDTEEERPAPSTLALFTPGPAAGATVE